MTDDSVMAAPAGDATTDSETDDDEGPAPLSSSEAREPASTTEADAEAYAESEESAFAMRAALASPRWFESLASRFERLGQKVRSLPFDRGIVLLAVLAASGAAVHFALHGRARLVVAGVIVSLITLLALRRPRLAVLAVLTYLPLMGEIRRLLLYLEPWTGMDPLNLVGPAVAGLLTVQVFAGRQQVPLTTNARMVLGLMVLMGLQVFNPLQGSPVVGMAGVMFYLVPLAWFWIGRTFIEQWRLERLLICLVVPLGVFTASMGLYQILFGFLPHQQQWIDESAYSAVWISYGKARAFSTFASGQEFAAFLHLASITCAALAMIRRNPTWLLPIPLLVGGIFVQGSRGPMVMLIVAFALVWAVQARDYIAWLPRLAVASVLGGAIGFVMLQSLGDHGANAAIAPVVAHQV
ncbi:MAG: hypothetical protein WD079_01965, partial [Phycisphaeraceae bacterium]